MESRATIIIPFHDRVFLVGSLNRTQFSIWSSEVAPTFDAISGIQFAGGTGLTEWRHLGAV
jgi:hypothetical protein